MELCPRSTSSARQEVRSLLAAGNTREAASLALSATEPDLDLLKVIEYAMLVRPIGDGVEELVETPLSLPEEGNTQGGLETAYAIGRTLAAIARSEVSRSPDFEIMKEIAQKRALHLPPQQAYAVSPLDKTIGEASVSSARALYYAGLANVLTIVFAHDAHALSYHEAIASTRASTQLALTRTLFHINDNRQNARRVEEYTEKLEQQESPEVGFLFWDGVTKKVYVSENPESGIAVAPSERTDVAVGCPLSFSPAIARKYYGYVVDAIDELGQWPAAVYERAVRT